MSSHTIAIIGSGFAALTAVSELRKRDRSSRITLISPKPEFIFLPSLIWIPSGIRKGEDLRVPLDKFFARMNVEHVAA